MWLELARGMANAQSEGNVPGSKPLTTLQKLKTNNKHPLDSASYRSRHSSVPRMSVLWSPPRKGSRFKRTFLRQPKGSLMKGVAGTPKTHRLPEVVESASMVKTLESIQRAKELSNILHLEYTRLCELNRLLKKRKEEFKQTKTGLANKQANKDDSLSSKEVKWESHNKLFRKQPCCYKQSSQISQKIPYAFTFVDSPRFQRRATDRDIVKVLERKVRGSFPVDRQNIVCGRLRKKFSLAYEPPMAMTRAQWQDCSCSLSGDFSDIWTNKNEEEFLMYRRMSLRAYILNAREIRSKWRKAIRIVKNIVHLERSVSYMTNILSPKNVLSLTGQESLVRSYHMETNLQMYTDLGGRALAAMLGSERPPSASSKEIKSSKPTLNKELTISTKVQEIMSTPPDSRTEEQLSLVLCDLQCVPRFCTFPLPVQEKIARFCFFISLGKNRVIIRRGQIPQNWYFIISGQAMMFEKCDVDTSSQTPSILSRGMSFGELGIKDNSCHKCTVTSRNNMHMIALDRVKYSSLFFDSEETPEHIHFMLEQEFMKYWPWEMLLEHPSECFNLFYPKNIVLVVDSTKSDWIYVIRSGRCIVYMYVPETKASWRDLLVSLPNTNINIESWPESKTDTGRFKIKRRKDQFVLYNRLSATNIRARDMEEIPSLSLRVPGRKWTLNQTKAKLDKKQDPVSFDGVNRNQSSDFDLPPIEGYKKKSLTFTLKSQMTERNADENLKEDETDCKIKVYVDHETALPQSVENKEPIEKHIRTIKNLTQDDIMKSKKTVLERQKQYKVPPNCKPRKPPPPQKSSPYSIVSPPVFVEMETLTPGDTFGLDQLREPGFDDKREKSAKVSLVSQGAEVIMINKRFFMANINEKTMSLIRTLVQVYPSQQDVQTRYRLQLAWKLYAMKVEDELFREFQYSGKKYYGSFFQEPPILDPIQQLAE